MGSTLLIFTAIIFVAAVVAGDVLKCYRRNEVQKCVKDCPPEKTCKNRNIQFRCADDYKRCRLACVCTTGHVRNYLGECVPEEECDKCPGPHEFYDCGSACDNECSTLGRQNRTNCPIINVKCNEKCYCEDGYARDRNNKCIPVAQCWKSGRQRRDIPRKCKVCKGPNEEYVNCKRTCPPETCISLVAKFKCPASACIPGCACKSGYLRLEEGRPCMPIKQCPQLANSPDFA